MHHGKTAHRQTGRPGRAERDHRRPAPGRGGPVPPDGGGPGGGYRFKLGGTPPLPAAGTTWTTRIKVQEAHDDGTESGGSVQRYTLKASYSYQPVKDATLSGCSYKIMPVEATFTGSNTEDRKSVV